MSETTWSRVEYRVGSRAAPAIDALVNALAAQFSNGACLLHQFEPREPATFDLAQRHDLNGLGHLLSAFLTRPEVQAALEQVQIPAAADLPPAFRAMSTFEFEGALTDILLTGGAYTRGTFSEERARAISREFVGSLVEDRRISCSVFSLEGAWTPWFYDIAWDHSYLVLDPQARHWWTLFMTDTD